MAITLDSSLALYYIPAAWLTAFYPVAMRTIALRNARAFNNVQPRSTAETAKGKLSEDALRRIERLSGAHTNGQEILPVWIAAIFAGLYAKVDNRTINIVALSFLGLRMAYNTIYINQSTQTQANLRSLVWLTGLAMPFTLLIKAANKVYAA